MLRYYNTPSPFNRHRIHNKKSIIKLSKRNYIFVPTLSEIYKSINDGIQEYIFGIPKSTKTKVWVNFGRYKDKSRDTLNHLRKYNNAGKQRSQWMTSVKDHGTYHFQRFQEYIHKSKGHTKRYWNTQKSAVLLRLTEKERLWKYIRSKKKAAWKKQWKTWKRSMVNVIHSDKVLVEIEEPVETSWFDADGYPRTSRDAITGRFVNPWNSESSNGIHSLIDFVSWKWQRFQKSGDLALRGDSAPFPCPPPIAAPSSSEEIQLQWIGHSTCLIHQHSFFVLTDPMFSDQASPVQHPAFGVTRCIPPSLSISQLPSEIDLVCISHDHYDHLDYDSVYLLRDRVKYWAVPLGIKDWLLQNIPGLREDRILEMQWWQSATLSKKGNDVEIAVSDDSSPSSSNSNRLTMTCAPAHHWGSRTPLDRNLRLWCSWALRSTTPNNPPLNFYFAGDTALPRSFPLFHQIGIRLGPFHLSALPIGAYSPSFFMRDSHCNPAEAVQIHKALGSRRSVAIHWGTFPLADEPLEEPPVWLTKELREEDFVVLRHGEVVRSGAVVDEVVGVQEDYEDYEDDDDLEVASM